MPARIEDRGTCFMLLEAKHMLPDDTLSLRALPLAAAYRLHCRARLLPALTDDEVLR